MKRSESHRKPEGSGAKRRFMPFLCIAERVADHEVNSDISFIKMGGNVMPIGVMTDSACIIVGGILGALVKEKIPGRIKQPLNLIFGICAIAIGLISLLKLESLPVVILSLILGTVIGELLDLDGRLKVGLRKVISKLNPKAADEAYLNFFVIVAVTFCASGTNIFGALYEGATGDSTILLSKAAMDIFAAMIFAVVLGYTMLLITIPQFLLLTALFYLGRVIMPYISADTLNNFMAVGGLMTFALGLAIADIKKVNAVNLLPSLLVVFPITALFHLIA